MTPEAARLAIQTKFHTEWPSAHSTYEMFFEGDKEPDLTNIVLPFVTFKIGLPQVEQGELAVNPMTRYTGLVEIVLFVPMGQHTKPFFEMLGSLESILAIQIISGIRMLDLVPAERQPAVGWQSREVFIRYSFDSNT